MQTEAERLPSAHASGSRSVPLCPAPRRPLECRALAPLPIAACPSPFSLTLYLPLQSGAKPCYFDLQCSQCNSDATRCLECWDGFHVAADGKCTPVSSASAEPMPTSLPQLNASPFTLWAQLNDTGAGLVAARPPCPIGACCSAMLTPVHPFHPPPQSNGCADPRCMECTPSEDQCKSCRDAFEMLRTIVPHWSSFDQRYPSGMQQLLNSSFPLYLGEDGWCHEVGAAGGSGAWTCHDVAPKSLMQPPFTVA